MPANSLADAGFADSRFPVPSPERFRPQGLNVLHRVMGHETVFFSSCPENTCQHIADFIVGLTGELRNAQASKKCLNPQDLKIGERQLSEERNLIAPTGPDPAKNHFVFWEGTFLPGQIKSRVGFEKVTDVERHMQWQRQCKAINHGIDHHRWPDTGPVAQMVAHKRAYGAQ